MNNQHKGSVTHQVFDQAADYYRKSGELACRQTFAEFVVQEGHPDPSNKYICGFFRESATPDYALSVVARDDRGLAWGQAVWLELKGFTLKAGEYTYKLNDRLHQYDMMIEDSIDGKAWGFYLVEWSSPDRNLVWKLYPVQELTRLPKYIQFDIRDGYDVPSPLGWPEFKPAIIDTAAKRQAVLENSVAIRNGGA